jgi:hypothetical protein
MAGEGSSSGAKRPTYHDFDSSDWDDIVATPMRRILSIPRSNMGILLGKRSWNGTTKKLQVCWSEHTFSIMQMGL